MILLLITEAKRFWSHKFHGLVCVFHAPVLGKCNTAKVAVLIVVVIYGLWRDAHLRKDFQQFLLLEVEVEVLEHKCACRGSGSTAYS